MVLESAVCVHREGGEMNEPVPLTVEWYLAIIDHPTVNLETLMDYERSACRRYMECLYKPSEIKQITDAIEAKRQELTAGPSQQVTDTAKLPPRQKTLF